MPSSDSWEQSPIRPDELERLTGSAILRVSKGQSTADLSWEVPAEAGVTQESTWEIERSGSPGGPFSTLAAGLSANVRTFRDDDIPAGRDTARNLYYRVILQRQDRRVVFGYNPAYDSVAVGDTVWGKTWGARGEHTIRVPGEVRRIRHLINMLMRKRSGEGAFLYRPAWAEGACSACSSVHTGTDFHGPSGQTCPACFGSGFTTGYYAPMRTLVGRSADLVTLQNIQISRTDRQDGTRVMLPHWPYPMVDDVLRYANGKLFLISAVEEGELYGHVAVTMATLSEMDRNHPLGSLPWPAKLDSTRPGPDVQYGRAMNLEDFQKGRRG